VLGLLLFMSLATWAQTLPLTGQVKDEKGDPVPFASVRVKGSAIGVSADQSGNFRIEVPANATLVVTAAGLNSKEVAVGNQTSLSVSLASGNNMEEVVVTALGIRREKRALGYSVSEVKGEDLTKANNQNVVNSLNGKVAGLQVVSSGGAPGQASRIIIRGGAKSITGNNQPLFVIDGVPVSNENDGSGTYTEVEGNATPNRIADINPEDIESMSVLKGSAASVLYGNRGANGVILITTKSGKGKIGVPVISVSSTVGMDNALKLPDFQTLYAQGSNGTTYAEGGSRSFGPKITGQTVFSNAKQANVTLMAHDPRNDFLQTGVTFNNNISLSQARENSNYFLSVGHSRQTSIVPNQDYNKASVRLNVNNQVTDKFSVGVNLNYLRTWGDVPDLGQSGNNPFFALFNMPVSWNINDYGYQRENGTQINFRGGAFDNPLWTVNKTYFNTVADRLIGAVNLNYKIVDGVDVTYRLGLDQLNDDRKNFKDQHTGSYPNGYLANDNIMRQEITSTFLVNINKHLNDDFGVSFTGGQDFNQRRLKNYTQTATALVVPGVAHMSNAASFDPDYEFRSLRRLIGIFGDLKFDYKNYLFLGVTGRTEWSSTLPQQNRNYFYPGVNASFIFTDALDLKSDVLSYGKIRAGYAQTARDPEPYQVINTFVVPAYTTAAGFGDGFVSESAPISFPFNGVPGYTVNNIINNPNLKSERTAEFEVGAELRLFKDKITVDATFFSNRNTNGIIPVDISPAAGADQLVVNSGLTTSNGIEIGLGLTPYKTSTFSWNMYITYSRIRSKVVETYPGVEQIYLGGFDGNPAIYAIKGQRYGSII